MDLEENGLDQLLKNFFQQDLQRTFLDSRRISLWGPVMDGSARRIVEQLLYLELKDKKAPITFFINSPGGSVTAGMAIYDAMQNIGCPVHTVCLGQAASMGSALLCAGEKGHRYAWPHARIMIHQPSIGGQMVAPASDIGIQAKEILRIKDILNEILAKHTGQTVEKILEDTDRDNFMSAEEAKKYGLIDKVEAER
jgi:ATP-dependent Clp protease protease subunit